MSRKMASEVDADSSTTVVDRRVAQRFPIIQEVHWKSFNGSRVSDTGTGQTINISTNAVFFNAGQQLKLGQPMELSIAWPVLLQDTAPMKLMVFGRVLRTQGCDAAVSIGRYEFHTAGRQFAHEHEHDRDVGK